MKPGASEDLEVTAYYSDGSSKVVTGEANYSRTSSYATIREGKVSLPSTIKLGMAITLTASYEGESATSVITVQDDSPVLERIAFKEASRTMTPGDSEDLEVTAYYSDGSSKVVTGEASYSRTSSYATIREGKVTFSEYD